MGGEGQEGQHQPIGSWPAVTVPPAQTTEEQTCKTRQSWTWPSTTDASPPASTMRWNARTTTTWMSWWTASRNASRRPPNAATCSTPRCRTMAATRRRGTKYRQITPEIKKWHETEMAKLQKRYILILVVYTENL